MLDIVLITLAMALGGAEGEGVATAGEATATAAGATSSASAQVAPAAGGAAEAGSTATYKAESQVPTGRFTTATEVKPILDVTRANWVAVREFDGRDLVYLTHLLSWRCGLVAIHVSINDGPLEEWPMEACHEDTNAPNALLDEDGVIYQSYDLGSIETVKVEIIYDDLTADTATFDRKGAMIP